MTEHCFIYNMFCLLAVQYLVHQSHPARVHKQWFCLPGQIVIRQLCSVAPCSSQDLPLLSASAVKESPNNSFFFFKVYFRVMINYKWGTGCACSSVLKPPAACSTSTVEPHQSEFTSHHSGLSSCCHGGGSHQAGWAGCRKTLCCMIIKPPLF